MWKSSLREGNAEGGRVLEEDKKTGGYQVNK